MFFGRCGRLLGQHKILIALRNPPERTCEIKVSDWNTDRNASVAVSAGRLVGKAMAPPEASTGQIAEKLPGVISAQLDDQLLLRPASDVRAWRRRRREELADALSAGEIHGARWFREALLAIQYKPSAVLSNRPSALRSSLYRARCNLMLGFRLLSPRTAKNTRQHQ
jgi:hypothetical protein